MIMKDRIEFLFHKEKLESLNTRINSIIERVSNAKNICPDLFR